MDIQAYSADTATNVVVEALKRDGAVVINDLADPEIADAVASDLRNHFDADGTYTQSDFNGYKTLRLSAILARSRASAELIGHDRILEVIDAILLPNCINYRIGSTTAIEILPGEDHQVLHCDDSIYPARMPGLEWQVGVMWAITDFTVENGATRVIPESHRDWMSEHWDKTKAVQTPMKKGSALIYMGSTVHGGGANQTDSSRIGLINTYSLGWLRQEVNQYLNIPRDVMDSYPEKIRRLMGYQKHGENLGYFQGDPDNSWYPE